MFPEVHQSMLCLSMEIDQPASPTRCTWAIFRDEQGRFVSQSTCRNTVKDSAIKYFIYIPHKCKRTLKLIYSKSLISNFLFEIK